MLAKIATKILFYIAILGFVLSTLAHIVTFFNFDPEKYFMVEFLFCGIILVVFSTMFLLNKLRRNKENLIVLKNGYKYYPMISLLLQVPVWMRIICVVLIIYTGISIFIGNSPAATYSGLMMFNFICWMLIYSFIRRNSKQQEMKL